MNEQTKHRLGDILVERGFISEEQLRQALRVQGAEGKRLGEVLVGMGALSADELNWALSELLGIPYVEFREEMVDLELARTMPEEVLRRHHAFPVLRVGDELTIILADPMNRQAVSEIEALTGTRVTLAIASRETIRLLLDKTFPPVSSRPGRVRYAEVGDTDVPLEADPSGVAQVYALLLGALREDASEIHVEPLPHEVRIRNRVSGRLIDRARLPQGVLGPVISRFRVLAGLRNEPSPRQAYVRTRLDKQEVEFEILFFPTLYGEAVTVRIWRRGLTAPTLETLELDGLGVAPLARLAHGPGLVFVTGWDPRARAALLYALAHSAAAPAKKVLTLERAVSFVVPEFVQVELAEDFGESAAMILAHPTDVAVVEDVRHQAACLGAITSAEQGALVVGGLGFATNGTALAHLLTLDLPRAALLGETKGFVHVQRHGSGHRVELFPMTDELRQELLSPTVHAALWTSRTS